MEEEITYSTVVFQNGKTRPRDQPVNKEDMTVYSEVKTKGKVPASADTIMVRMREQRSNLTDLRAENEEMEKRNGILMNETEQLSGERARLNWTLGVILTFNNFPVKAFCPEKKCQPCQKGWILYRQKCYLFTPRLPGSDWRTWEGSREFCRDTAADLVVVDDLQEMEFISNHTKFYYDKFHGFWIGLQEINKNWVWTDGRNDTLGYWLRKPLGEGGSFALMIPGKNLTESWNKAGNEFKNRFICEAEVLVRSS
ncbi:natural killer cells antigen CD94-like isoform X2 [Cololabis saira]|uniref:natural killer cells antigen CD94-like isoform X2 n=1 Tax=Cololabis saira TaxID=129043 RepID=UPI002AD23078|nr:natural killer cells antigen CD94-like isoform X2 [Cololabis saira]